MPSFQIFAKGLADVGLGGVVVALAVKLAGTCQRVPGLEVLGYGFVKQRALRVARVVELWLCTRWPARVRMRLRWACGGGHGAVPAWAGRLMILGLYPDLPANAKLDYINRLGADAVVARTWVVAQTIQLFAGGVAATTATQRFKRPLLPATTPRHVWPGSLSFTTRVVAGL